jgi:DNA adenine methylase
VKGAGVGVGTIIKYPGSKGRLAEWISGHMPRHEVYVEPFAGSLAVFFAKHPARLETINDLDERVVNLWRMIRQRPDELAAAVAATPWSRRETFDVLADIDAGDEVERARRLLVWCWQQIGRRTNSPGSGGSWRWTKDAGSNPVPMWRTLPERILQATERLRHAQIECRPALEVIAAHASPDVLLYCDPPYTRDVVARSLYRHAMTDDDHRALLATLEAHPGPVLLSGYDNPIYAAALGHWWAVRRPTMAEGGRARTETLWLNPVASERLGRERRLVPVGRLAGLEA